MRDLRFFPILKLFTPFLMGILFVLLTPNLQVLPATAIIIAIFALLITLIIASYKLNRDSLAFGIATFVVLFLLGYFNTVSKQEFRHSNHFSKTQTEGYFILEIAEPLQEKENSLKTVANVKVAINNDIKTETTGKALLYFSKDSTNTIPQVGNTLVCYLTFNEISPPNNIGSFNYKKYLQNKNIFHQGYLKGEYYKILDIKNTQQVLRLTAKMRAYFVNTLKKANLDERELGIAAALIFGQRDLIDPEINETFSGAGVMHILSVSGLHVGIIFVVASFLAKIIYSNKRWAVLTKSIFVLLTIWFYAVLTGLSPSVSRAATMFSFVTLGRMSNNNTHTVNSVATSAFVILSVNPFLITNMGFLFSYFAVIGIVFINPLIKRLLRPKNKIAKYFWELTSVSLSAQIATAPLSVLFFKQFSNYFLFANYIAIPLVAPIIYLGLATIATSFIPAVSMFFGYITNWIINILIKGVFYVEALPYSVSSIYTIKTPETIVIYAIIILLTVMLIQKKRKLIFPALALCLVLFASVSVSSIKTNKQQLFYVFNDRYKSAFCLVDGNTQFVFADSAVLNSSSFNNFSLDGTTAFFNSKNVKKIALNNNVESNDHVQVSKLNHCDYYFINHNDKKIGVVRSNIKLHKCNKPVVIDYLILTNKAPYDISRIVHNFDFKSLIIDSSVSNYKAEAWNKYLESLDDKKFDIHNVKTDGYYLAFSI
ncbi:MAG: ComEC/Rec2 family competence protein [Bacteroidales bacterium]|jgi:competence protein ComEC